jgi:thioesterase domain-containing protein
VLNLYDVARRLDPERPFIGVQAPGTDGITAMPATIEAMASAYLAEIRAHQASGPFHISGYCGGGIVAFEMARQLLAAGETVELVTLLDCPCPALPASPPLLRRWLQLLVSESLGGAWRRGRARLAATVEAASSELRLGWSRWRGVPVPYEVREYWLIKQFRQATRSYVLRPAPFRLLVLRARDGASLVPDADEALGWTPYAAAVEAHALPGDHYSITREPNVMELVTRVEAALQEVERLAPGGASGGP